jgi:hypothetical protein
VVVSAGLYEIMQINHLQYIASPAATGCLFPFTIHNSPLTHPQLLIPNNQLFLFAWK